MGLWGVLVLGVSGEERSVRRVILHGKVMDPAGFRSFKANGAPHAANTRRHEESLSGITQSVSHYF